MNIYDSIVTALVVGAKLGLSELAQSGIKDAYSALKKLLLSKYQKLDLNLLEQKPDSKARQDVVKEDLAEKDITDNQEILDLVSKILTGATQIAQQSPEPIGVKIEQLEAASLIVKDVQSLHTGVEIKGSKVAGDVRIEGISISPEKKK